MDHRLIARDRRMAAVHEAGHVVVAMHLGLEVQRARIRPNFTDNIRFEKSYVGQTAYVSPPDLERRRLIAVAGMVAERIWRERGPALECWAACLSDPNAMSVTDWSCAGCEPGEPDDALIAAAETVDDLLGRRLLPQLQALSRRLIQLGEVRP